MMLTLALFQAEWVIQLIKPVGRNNDSEGAQAPRTVAITRWKAPCGWQKSISAVLSPSGLPTRFEREPFERTPWLFSHRNTLPVRPWALDSIPLPRLPHDTRTECGDYAGGATGAWRKAL